MLILFFFNFKDNLFFKIVLIIYRFSLLFLIIGTTIAVDYKCNYNNRYIGFAGETFYDCKIIKGSISDESQQEVEEIAGRHGWGYSDSDVESLSIKKKKHALMPTGVENYFDNLKCLDVYDVGLRKVYQEDLEPYPELKYLSLANNKLTVLEKYLFQKNPELEIILLHGNQIKFVNAAFQDLDNLHSLNFNDNECHSGEVKNSEKRVSDLIEEIYEDCNL